MAYKLCANIDMFSLNQKIFLVDGTSVSVIASVPTNQVGAAINNLIYSKNIDEIQIAGTNNYIDHICKEIKNNKYKKVRIYKNGKIFN